MDKLPPPRREVAQSFAEEEKPLDVEGWKEASGG